MSPVNEKIELLSRRQLKTVHETPFVNKVIHCGPFGCGKSHAVNLAIGMYCLTTEPPKDAMSMIIFVGRTLTSVKANICNYLTSMFGDYFRYDAGKSDGIVKDALMGLPGKEHKIRFIGLNDSSAAARFQGANAYAIFGDEVSTWSEENYNKVMGRRRGPLPKGQENHLFVASCNPDSPTHWLWKMKNSKKCDFTYVKWTEHDNITSGAKKYYEELRAAYASNEAYLQRYVYGEWTAADDIVYPEFKFNYHVITDKLVNPDEILQYRISVDFGSKHPSAVLLLAKDRYGTWMVLKEWYHAEKTITEVIQAIRNFAVGVHEKLEKIYVDSAAKALIDEMRAQGFNNVVGADKSVLDGINYIKDLFRRDELYIHQSCNNLINELHTYSFSKKEDETVDKKNDHACDSLRYGIYTNRR